MEGNHVVCTIILLHAPNDHSRAINAGSRFSPQDSLSQRVLGVFTRVVNGVVLGEMVRHIFAAPRLNLDVIDPSIDIPTGQLPVESIRFDLLP